VFYERINGWMEDDRKLRGEGDVRAIVPTYLADDIHLASERSARSLRSSSERKCSVSHVHSRFGDRCFTAAGPRIWINLPASLRDKEVSCTELRRQLKTCIFQTDCCAMCIVTSLIIVPYKYSYLLIYLRQNGHFVDYVALKGQWWEKSNCWMDDDGCVHLQPASASSAASILYSPSRSSQSTATCTSAGTTRTTRCLLAVTPPSLSCSRGWSV